MSLLLKITLSYTSKPPVWRKILIAADATFEDLHHAIQVSFGWENYHLWEFTPRPYQGDPRIGPKGDDLSFGLGEPIQVASQVKLAEVFGQPKAKFSYVYDMGDSWEHQIVLEEISEEPAPTPQCVAGKGACPPEDCGGIPGYYELVEAVNHPKHPNHADMMDWLGLEAGEKWDVSAFDLEKTQAEMKRAFR